MVSGSAGEQLWLDTLETEAERLRGQLGVTSLSVSRFLPMSRALATVVNVGALGPGESRQPTLERYPLRYFPAAASLVTKRRPYISTPTLPGDVASVALQIALDKSSQAAAPLVLGGAVWGELWVASEPRDLPIDRQELALVCWASERFAGTLGELVHDLQPQLGDDRVAESMHRYEVWVDGHLDPELALSATGAVARSEGGCTALCGDFEAREICALIVRLGKLGFILVGVGRDGSDVQLAACRSGGTAPEYEIRFAGLLPATAFEQRFDVIVRREIGATVIVGRLDPCRVAALFAYAAAIGARLISVTRRDGAIPGPSGD